MCRLLGIYGFVDNWQEFLLQFQQLAEKGKIPDIPNIEPGHVDGWGMASVKSDNLGMELIGKYLGNALAAPEYKEKVFAFSSQPQVFLCHLRKASPTIRISLPNSQPFIALNWAFIHNGTVYDAETLNEITSYPITSDHSDSEYYFHYLLKDIAEERKQERLIQKLINHLTRIKVNYSALNCILSNGSEMYIIRSAAKHHEYYSLFYYQTNSGVVVCSEKLSLNHINESYWNEIPNQSVLSITDTPPRIKLVKY